MRVELDASVEEAVRILRECFDLPPEKENELRTRLEIATLVDRQRAMLRQSEQELAATRKE
jgi:hypothetical protein